MSEKEKGDTAIFQTPCYVSFFVSLSDEIIGLAYLLYAPVQQEYNLTVCFASLLFYCNIKYVNNEKFL